MSLLVLNKVGKVMQKGIFLVGTMGSPSMIVLVSTWVVVVFLPPSLSLSRSFFDVHLISYTRNGHAGTSGSGWASGSSLALPFEGVSSRSGGTRASNGPRMSSSSRGRPKVAINIE